MTRRNHLDLGCRGGFFFGTPGMAISRTESGKPGEFSTSSEVAENIIERLILKGHTREEAEKLMALLYRATD
jgi:hypothetical protein